MMHDIISDILVSDSVPHGWKRDVIYAQLREMADSTSQVISWDDWRAMGDMMGGAEAMGGPAVGIVPKAPGVAPGDHRQHDSEQQP